MTACGPPIRLPESPSREEVEECRQQLEDSLLSLTRDLERHLGLDPADWTTRGDVDERKRLRGRGIRVVRAVVRRRPRG